MTMLMIFFPRALGSSSFGEDIIFFRFVVIFSNSLRLAPVPMDTGMTCKNKIESSHYPCIFNRFARKHVAAREEN